MRLSAYVDIAIMPSGGLLALLIVVAEDQIAIIAVSIDPHHFD